MSIASEIVRLQTAKEDLATAIEGKGVTVPVSVTLDGYANLVDQIAQGADLQSKSVSYTPTEYAQGSTITADSGYDGLSSVDISVGAISSSYVGSGIARKSSSDLTASGDTVTVPAGYYESAATKSVASGSEGTPTAAKGTVLNHSVIVTPSVTNTAGYISGGTKIGTPVAVTAAELVSGSDTYTSNGTYDVTNLEEVVVDIPPASLQTKTASYTPTESAQSDTITADTGYDGLSSVDVSVGAISSTYVGSGITRRSSSDLTASNATVTAPAGYYSAAATKTISSGTVTAPSTISGTSATVTTGTNTLTLTKTVSVTPSVTTSGYISSGTAGNSSVSLQASVTTQAATTITPTTSDQTPIAAGTYCTGAIKVSKIPNQATGGAKYATTSSQTLVTAPKYITSNITLGALSQTNLTAANIKSGVNVKISNGSTNVWNITGTAPIRYSYSNTLTPSSSAKKNFSCSSNTGVSTVNAFYVSFNPGFVPTVVLCVCTSQTLFRSSYDSRLGTYVLMNESGNYYACTGFTMTSSSVIVPVCPNWNTGLSFYVSAWA